VLLDRAACAFLNERDPELRDRMEGFLRAVLEAQAAEEIEAKWRSEAVGPGVLSCVRHTKGWQLLEEKGTLSSVLPFLFFSL